MKTFSVLIAWDDSDPEQESFGTTVRANSYEEAEAKARAEMRTAHLEAMRDDYGGDEEAACAAYTSEDGTFGGRVLDISEGAIWRAADMETALRDLVRTEMFLPDHPERQAAYKAARDLVAGIDSVGA